MFSKTVLVTGVSGFIGSHVVSQLLEEGYKVRAVVRSEKKFCTIFPNATKDQLEVVQLAGLSSDHTEALRGVDALIHVASPVYLNVSSSEEIFNGAYHGAIGVVETAIKVGTKKIVVTSTVGALFEPDLSDGFGINPKGPKSWGSLPLEKIDTTPTGPGPRYVYLVAKTVAEKRIWELADEHPEIDFTTILPSAVWGPFLPTYIPTLSSDASSLGSNHIIHALLNTPVRQYPNRPMGIMVDVRDVARAHVLALEAPPLPNREHKRLIINKKNYIWSEVVKALKAKYPDSKTAERLPADDAILNVQISVPLDNSLAERAIGFDKYCDFEETVADAFASILEWERQFKA